MPELPDLGAHHPEICGLVPMSPVLIVANKLLYLSPLVKHLIAKRD